MPSPEPGSVSPVDRSLDLKAAAAALRVKRVAMADPKAADIAR
jgi:prolyl-tRNA editing enzyme YbaK/EbsC (Cys-tRNA(Pro) deacylase)